MPSQAVTGDLADVLHTAGPHPSLADVSRLFDRFVGTWDTEYTKLDQDGQVRQRFAGEVVFGWIADGLAMQDVWISLRGPRTGEDAQHRHLHPLLRYEHRTMAGGLHPAPGQHRDVGPGRSRG